LLMYGGKKINLQERGADAIVIRGKPNFLNGGANGLWEGG